MIKNIEINKDELIEDLMRQLIDINHAMDIFWNDGRSQNAEKYICFQQKKSQRLLENINQLQQLTQTDDFCRIVNS